MANQWFRMYSEFATDPKVQMMSETLQRRFVMLLCLRCNAGETFHVTMTDDIIAFQLRISDEEWMATKQVFISKNMLTDDNNIVNWDKRQFVSDSSTERVRKYREHKKEVKQECNVSVTPPDTETDTEYKNTVSSVPEEDGECLDQEIAPEQPREEKPAKNNYPEDFNTFFQAFPHKDGVSKKKAFEAWKKARDKPSLHDLLAKIEILKRSDQWLRGIIPHPSTWLNGKCWETVGATLMQNQIVDQIPRPEIFDPATVFGEGFKLEY